ncbi:hypothetical protein FUT87_02910 [Mitsuaria sp. TWR114]|uniref:hypothetical protein n=1 Tax=Mitsuaria sp. TWR114 TaxID=2601731 RepID=UPI0011BFBB65|nr:hypothetical protein [Mitsuaria sp. TWR114]TXD99426.1 hypothetical protein FUT87_02910 [Mitsuaria sp. TWR114]
MNDFRPLDGGLDAQNSIAFPSLVTLPTPNLVNEGASVAGLAPTVWPSALLPLTSEEISALGLRHTANSQARLLRACQHFVATTRVRDMANIPPGTVAAYLDGELSRGLATETVVARFTALAAVSRLVLKVADQASGETAFDAERENLLARVEAVRREQGRSEVEGVWRLLNSPAFVELRTSSTFEHRTAYWAVLLLLFTGVRLSSLSRVSPWDFEWVSCWGYFMRYQQLGAVKRHLVHDELFRCGFSDFVEERQGAALLFSDGRPETLLRIVQRVVSYTWPDGANAMRPPSLKAFRMARALQANEVLQREADLRRRLDSYGPTERPATARAALWVDLERAIRFERVRWEHHRCPLWADWAPLLV